MSDYRYTRSPTAQRALFYGRQFAWIARTMVKVAHECELTDHQFLKMVEVLARELESTNPRFNKRLFEQHIRVAALEVKALEEGL